MDVHDKLDELTALVESARSMPMSASCIVNRAEVLGLLDEMRAAAARGVRPGRAASPARGSRWSTRAATEAERIIAEAHEERMRLVSQTEVYAQAQREAGRIRGPRRDEEAGRMQDETDAYVDGKLATFEITLNKTLGRASRPRARPGCAREDDDGRPGVDERPLPGA